ncbi:MAG: hypothetical protein HC929_24360 [Leptolyngbyaceae cyanobacterium SM2_5_2]|nr:hypothetical protein [Leptolyngbyaceae cyanobacterium SM2_5_2]
MAQGLSNNTFVVFPANGHGAIGTVCSVGMMAEFLDNPARSPDTSCANDGAISFISDANTLIKPGTVWLADSVIGADRPILIRRLGLLIFFLLFPVIWLVMRHRDRKQHPEHYPMALPALANLAVVCGLLLGLFSLLWLVLQIIQVGTVVITGGHGQLGYTQLFVGIDRHMAWIYGLPILMALTSVALLVLALLSWRGKYWDRNRRIYFSILTGMALVYTFYLAQAGQLTVFF